MPEPFDLIVCELDRYFAQDTAKRRLEYFTAQTLDQNQKIKSSYPTLVLRIYEYVSPIQELIYCIFGFAENITLLPIFRIRHTYCKQAI
jgi:hypothetical protein